MFHLTYANRTEALASALAERVAARRAEGVSALVPTHIVVPNRHVERYVEMRLAEGHGVAGNLRFHRLERFVRSWLASTTGSRPLDRRAHEGAILSVLLDDAALAAPELAPLDLYVNAARGTGAADARRAQLATRLASLFEAYAFSRPKMLRAWQQGRSGIRNGSPKSLLQTETWQRALFAEIRERIGRRPLFDLLSQAASYTPEQTSQKRRHALPDEIHVFGLSYVAPVYTWALRVLGDATELRVYTLNPCMEFWEDVPSASELRARLPKRGATAPLQDPDPAAELHADDPLHVEGDPPALTHWGRPGREHIRQLNELTGASFDPRFTDPGDETLLNRFQRDVLFREVTDAPKEPGDGSIRCVGCASVRRELEFVAESIWRQLREDPTLRFNDIAVLIPQSERSVYLPHLQAVFSEARRIPHHVVDLPLATESRVVEAAQMLLGMASGDFRRPDVLALLTHPLLRVPGGRGDIEGRARWVDLVDSVGVFHGLDRDAHAGTYVQEDLLNWDQGARRLALGAFMTGERSHDTRAFVDRDGEPYLPEDAPSDANAPALATLIRALCSDVRFAREAKLPLREWATFFSGLFRGYLAPRDAREESELRRCLAQAEALAERPLHNTLAGEEPRVRHRLAAELLGADLGALGGTRGDYLAEGVVVSALAPMRAIPSHTVYVLGLGEGLFPTNERRDPMDLRGAGRKIGDVTPPERDRYIFLEAMLGARSQFCCTWVARDALSGDAIGPSTVVVQLLDTLERHYVDSKSEIESRAPLRRHETARADAALAESYAERRALHFDAGDAEALRADADARQFFRLPELPATASEGTTRISLAALRRFLEDPAQGWARSMLRLDDFDIESHASREDEPLDSERLIAAMTLRSSFLDALTKRRAPLEAYRERATRLAARGQWPVGVLREHREARDAQVLDAWRRAYTNAVSAHQPPERVRFGEGLEPGESAVLAPPISLRVPSAHGDVEVELVGRTEALLESRATSLVLVTRGAKTGAALVQERLRYGLRGYIDHLALSASRTDEPKPHRTMVLFGGMAARESSTHFQPVDPARARAILTRLVSALSSRSHAYFLPGDAILRCAPRWRVATPEMLGKALAATRREERGTWRYGPIPHPERLPALPLHESLRLAQDRYDDFFELTGMGRSSAAGAPRGGRTDTTNEGRPRGESEHS